MNFDSNEDFPNEDYSGEVNYFPESEIDIPGTAKMSALIIGIIIFVLGILCCCFILFVILFVNNI